MNLVGGREVGDLDMFFFLTPTAKKKGFLM